MDILLVCRATIYTVNQLITLAQHHEGVGIGNYSTAQGTVEPVYNGHCIRQPPLYKDQLQLDHGWLS